MDDVRIKLEEGVLDRIKDRVDFFQSPGVKSIILNAFLDFFNSYETSKYEIKYLEDENEKENFIKELQSYGIIDSLLDDPEVEDIIINGTEPIYIHHRQEGLKKTDKQFESIGELNLLIKKFLVFSGKKELKKINNIDFPGMRGRVNIVYSPLGPELTITKIKTNPLSIIDLIENGTLNTEMAALLWLYVEGLGLRPANILISGGPGSGKTTLLNALLSFIPSDQHIVLIEDTLELVTNWIGNVSRLESNDDLSLSDLVKNSLRMRPERILVGEVRGQEAEDMMTAMNIGKYCMATIHASTTRETILRLQTHPMNIPETSVNLIDVFIVMGKTKLNQHIVRVVEEITETAGLEQKTVLISPLWKFDHASGNFNKLSPITIYRDKLSQTSGLNGKQILDEINKRKDFLDRLRENKINFIKDVSFYCELYAKDSSDAYSEIKNKNRR